MKAIKMLSKNVMGAVASLHRATDKIIKALAAAATYKGEHRLSLLHIAQTQLAITRMMVASVKSLLTFMRKVIRAHLRARLAALNKLRLELEGALSVI